MSSFLYRTLAIHEQDAVLRLWSTVLGDPYEDRRRLFLDFVEDPLRFAHTYVAVAPDGTIGAAMAYWVRQVSASQGHLPRVGHLWGAATHPAFRKQGHATQLAKHLITAMKQEGCQWAVLFAREEARHLYTQLGWQGFPIRYCGGLVDAAQLTKHKLSHTIRAYAPYQAARGWEPLASIYADYNRNRPLSLIRTDAYWQGYIAWMAQDWLTNQRATYLVATADADPATIQGYALVHFYDAEYAKTQFDSPPWFHVSEIGVRHPSVLQDLIAGVATQALAQGIGYGHYALPQEEGIDTALGQCLVQPLSQEVVQGTMMVRPLADAVTMADLEALYAAPGAWFWEIDQF